MPITRKRQIQFNGFKWFKSFKVNTHERFDIVVLSAVGTDYW